MKNTSNNKKTMKRAKNNTGHIRWREDKQLWEGQFLFESKRRSVYGKTQVEVRTKLTETYNEILSGTYIEGSSDLLANWLRQYNREYVPVKSKTTYNGFANNHIIPTIGTIKLKKLTTKDIQEKLIDFKEVSGRADNKEGGLDSKSIRNIVSYLSAALDKSIKNRYIAENPCNSVILPEKDRTKIEVLDNEQTNVIIDTFQTLEIDDEDFLFINCAFILMSTGVRRGEFLALREQHLFEDYFSVEYSLKRYYKDIVGKNKGYIKVDYFTDPENKTAIYLSKPKTPKSIREVVFNEDVKRAFDNLRLYQENLSKGYNFNKYKFLVCRPDGQCYDPDLFTEKMKNTLSRVLNCDYNDNNVHKLRHFFATNACSQTKDVATVSKMLGHAKVSTTLDMYCHSDMKRKRKLVSSLKIGA